MPTPPQPTKHFDIISLRNLHTTAIIGPDAWARHDKPQPLILSLQLTIDTTSAGTSDNVAHTFSYGQMSKDIVAKVERGDFMSIDHLTSEIASLADNWPGETLKITALAPHALLRVEGGFGRELMLRRRTIKIREFEQLVWYVDSHEWFMQGIKVACVIGVNMHERLEKQGVVVDLRTMGEGGKEEYSEQIREGGEMWRRLGRRVCEVCWLYIFIHPISAMDESAALVWCSLFTDWVVRLGR
jgi:FolB domain-containing protein